MGKKSRLLACLDLPALAVIQQERLPLRGHSGQLKVVLKEDDADLATAKRLAKSAIEKFVDQNGRFPTEKETRKLKSRGTARTT